MNYLALSRRTARECGVTASSTIPAAVTSQSGELLRIVDWVAQAYAEIQAKHTEWRWLRSKFSVNTVANDDTYAGTDCADSRLAAAITRFARWLPFDENGYANVMIYKSADGIGTQRWLPFMPWANFRAIYALGTQTAAPPAFCTIDPQNNLVLGPKPDGIYVVTGEFQMSAQSLAADGDTPEMPSDFHMLVVYEAMKKYGAFEAAVEVFQRGAHEGGGMMRDLEINQLPAVALAAPLA